MAHITSRDDIIAVILKKVKEKGLSEEEFWRLVRDKIKEVGGLLEEEAAAMIVAKNLGISIPPGKNVKLGKLYITDIVDGLRKLEITGRVLSVDPPLTFYKKGGKEVKLAKILIGDRTGTIRVTLWPPHTELVEEMALSLGDIVKVRNARTKRFRERLEVNVGDNSAIMRVPSSQGEDLPPLEDFIKDKILEFKSLKVVSVCPPIDARTKWGFKKVSCIEANLEENLKVKIFLWGSKAYWAYYIKPGDIVTIRGNLRPREKYSIGSLNVEEYHTSKYFSVTREGFDKEVLGDLLVSDYRNYPPRVFLSLVGFITTILPGRGNGIRVLMSDGKRLALIDILHLKPKEQLLKEEFERLFLKQALLRLVEPSSGKRLEFKTSLWSSFVLKEHVLKRGIPVKDFQELEPGSFVDLKASIRKGVFEVSYYCDYCLQRVESIEHHCFTEREIRVLPLPLLKLFLEKDDYRVYSLVPPLDNIYKSLFELERKDLVDFFVENEDIRPALNYLLEEKVEKKEKVHLKGFTFDMPSGKKLCIVCEISPHS
ncbi:MAG: hypothetical protein DRJ51_05205 [Thermoprotei archaeon]|nr:MAG: hypothetical protein DRJ51_05205 [Thermoprotei archaeon]RLF02712.1 MAG: hypothetical protein DRJ59_02875 [Thermoprotei archaeon]